MSNQATPTAGPIWACIESWFEGILMERYKRMLHTKYIFSRPCSFWQEDLEIVSYWFAWQPEYLMTFIFLNNFKEDRPMIIPGEWCSFGRTAAFHFFNSRFNFNTCWQVHFVTSFFFKKKLQDAITSVYICLENPNVSCKLQCMQTFLLLIFFL